jgi:beta-lysine 5,6-aminomutase alpha subunit
MSKLNLDRDKIDQAKQVAEQIVHPVQHFIDRHTTVSIERCVLRLMGVQGPAEENPEGPAPEGRMPLVNQVIDALGPERLERGAGYWLGLVALHHPKLDPTQVARKIAEGKVNLDKLEERTFSEIDGVCQRFLKPQLETLRKNRELKSKRPPWGNMSQPLRYIIVATGNIHEDLLQAQAAVEMGADIIAVIRSTAQSLLDYVPEGATTEGFGGTFATQENFRLMREALREIEKAKKRRVGLTNYSSGLCMPEIAVLGALEGVDYLLNDAMYGILFRDINMKRNFVDQFFSRRICALSGITIQTGEDNYLTTAESYKYWFQVLASHFINYAFAKRAGIAESGLALGHAFEMDPTIEDSMLYEWAQAQLVRELFPRAPLKFMPPTKHKSGDIFFSYLYDGMFNLAGAITGQTIQLLGMHTEAIHNPFIQDRYLSLKNANYIFRAAKGAKDEIFFQPHGKVARRARQVFDDALRLLKKVRMHGLFRAIEEGAFANVRRRQEDGKGLEGVLHKARDYYTPLQQYLTPRALREAAEGRPGMGREGARPRPSGLIKKNLRLRQRGERDRNERDRGPRQRGGGERGFEKPRRERNGRGRDRRAPEGIREPRHPREAVPEKRREAAPHGPGRGETPPPPPPPPTPTTPPTPPPPPKSFPPRAPKEPVSRPPREISSRPKSEAQLQAEFHKQMISKIQKEKLRIPEEGKEPPARVIHAPGPPPLFAAPPKPPAPPPAPEPAGPNYAPLPRRSLKVEGKEEKKDSAPLVPEPEPEKPLVSPAESSAEYQPLPRRNLKEE